MIEQQLRLNKQHTMCEDFLAIPKSIFKDNKLDTKAKWLYVTLLYCKEQGVSGKDITYIEGSFLNKKDYYRAKDLLINGGYIDENCNILRNK